MPKSKYENRRIAQYLNVKTPNEKTNKICYCLSYSKETKSYNLAVFPTKRENGIEVTYLYSGYKAEIEKAKKFSRKRLDELWADLNAVSAELLPSLIQRICDETNTGGVV